MHKDQATNLTVPISQERRGMNETRGMSGLSLFYSRILSQYG
jgi:hypothetical protein